jgi:hypothetical protein
MLFVTSISPTSCVLIFGVVIITDWSTVGVLLLTPEGTASAPGIYTLVNNNAQLKCFLLAE